MATRIGEAARRIAQNGSGAGQTTRRRVRAALPDGVSELDLTGGVRRAARDRLDSVWPSSAYPATPGAAEQADSDYGRPATPGWRERDWREHLRRVDVDGQQVNYVDLGVGDGPPVVFIHGLGGNWQNWLENLPTSAQRRRVLALDLPGFGMSPVPADGISISSYGRLVDAWLDRLGVGPVAVVGNSMGGFVGAELAIQFPGRVERLVLAAAAGISITNLRRRPMMTFARVTAALGALTASRSRDIIVRNRLRHVVLSTIVRHPSRLAPDLLCEIMRGSGKSGYVDALEALVSYDFRDSLGDIRCPTLIVWGREDMLVPVRDAAEFERLIPSSRQIVMEDTGHVPMLERPDAFNRCLLGFLDEAERDVATI
jgi:pimeloyl-ACP methyl ester carboxylesterase